MTTPCGRFYCCFVLLWLTYILLSHTIRGQGLSSSSYSYMVYVCTMSCNGPTWSRRTLRTRSTRTRRRSLLPHPRLHGWPLRHIPLWPWPTYFCHKLAAFPGW